MYIKIVNLVNADEPADNKPSEKYIECSQADVIVKDENTLTVRGDRSELEWDIDKNSQELYILNDHGKTIEAYRWN